MKFWRIKWELILTVLAGITVIAGVSLYNYMQDARVMAMTIVATFIFAMFVLSYKHIRYIRHQML
jgi:hypothetical protein